MLTFHQQFLLTETLSNTVRNVLKDPLSQFPNVSFTKKGFLSPLLL